MIKADKYYIDNLTEIIENGYSDKSGEVRPKYKDGTPSHTRFITQVFEKYDISKGEFPITTLRNTAIKTGIREVLWIYQKQSNNKQNAHEMGILWWDNWMNEFDNIGRAYSHNLESHRIGEVKKEVRKIKKRIVDEKDYEITPIKKIKIEKSIDGKIYNTSYRNYGDYIIIDEFIKDNRNYVTCQFLDTGYKTDIRKDSLKKGQHPMDNLKRTLNSIGYLDNYKDVKNFTNDEVKILKKIWTRMIRRCYDDSGYRKAYEDIYVHNKWHSFKNFLQDVRHIPQYHLAKEHKFKDWHLDKDYYGSNCYSKDTCVFLEMSENIIYRNTQIDPIVIFEENSKSYELTYSSLATKLNKSKSHVIGLVDKGNYGEITFDRVKMEENYVYRYELSRNQINELLSNLEKKPFSRRHIISLWNWANIDKKELVECAYETIWTCRKVNEDIYIDLTLVQRSSDYIMANAINKSQYVVLMMMICGHLCHETGLRYKPGNFAHLVQNLHIYDRHIEQAKELLKREPLNQQPSIELKENKNFYDYTIDDFIIKNIDGIKKLDNDLEIAI